MVHTEYVGDSESKDLGTVYSHIYTKGTYFVIRRFSRMNCTNSLSEYSWKPLGNWATVLGSLDLIYCDMALYKAESRLLPEESRRAACSKMRITAKKIYENMKKKSKKRGTNHDTMYVMVLNRWSCCFNKWLEGENILFLKITTS